MRRWFLLKERDVEEGCVLWMKENAVGGRSDLSEDRDCKFDLKVIRLKCDVVFDAFVAESQSTETVMKTSRG